MGGGRFEGAKVNESVGISEFGFRIANLEKRNGKSGRVVRR